MIDKLRAERFSQTAIEFRFFNQSTCQQKCIECHAFNPRLGNGVCERFNIELKIALQNGVMIRRIMIGSLAFPKPLCAARLGPISEVSSISAHT